MTGTSLHLPRSLIYLGWSSVAGMIVLRESTLTAAAYTAVSLPYAELQVHVLSLGILLLFLAPAIPQLRSVTPVLISLRHVMLILLYAPLPEIVDISRPTIVLCLLDLIFRYNMPGLVVGYFGYITGVIVIAVHGGAAELATVPFLTQLKAGASAASNLTSITVLLIAAISVSRYRKERDERAMLEQEITQLSKANVLFQEYALSIAHKTADAERKRISREIHDSAGHALMGLKMLLQAAKNLMLRDPVHASEILEKGMAQIQVVLDDIRLTLRALRKEMPGRALGMHNIVRIVDDFRSATGIRVTTHFTVSELSHGSAVDSAVSRLVQESLTNAIRHGHADHVVVHFRSHAGSLVVSVSDDGVGSESISPGIGISGMQERIESLGGTLSCSSTSHGFSVEATIPLLGQSSRTAS